MVLHASWPYFIKLPTCNSVPLHMSHFSQLQHILQQLNIPSLNAMQQAAIASIAQTDVILLSPTGSGKTLAFLLPLVLNAPARPKTTKALIIVPTRELAQQIERVFRSMGTGYKITACYGGHHIQTEENNLTEAPWVIVGTPGRLADHLERGNINTSNIDTLILDEYDKILELGFEEAVSGIIQQLPAISRRILTSATSAVEPPAFTGLQNPQTLDFLPKEENITSSLTLQVLHSPVKDKFDTLLSLLCHLHTQLSIIFCNHREAAERVSSMLAEQGVANACYHGGMEQQDRDTALCKFRNGSVWCLVATDIAARGLDIAGVQSIIHYHLPHDAETFTHRNGRTARMNATGSAILLIGPEEQIPTWAGTNVPEIQLNGHQTIPPIPRWTTLFIAAGKKDKVNKVDVAGFLSHVGGLKRDEIGLIEIRDRSSMVAVPRAGISRLLPILKAAKIKGQKVMIAVAR